MSASPCSIFEELLDKLGDPFPGGGLPPSSAPAASTGPTVRAISAHGRQADHAIDLQAEQPRDLLERWTTCPRGRACGSSTHKIGAPMQSTGSSHPRDGRRPAAPGGGLPTRQAIVDLASTETVLASPIERARSRSLRLADITAQGTALPCCIAPFTDAPYASITMGNYPRDGVDAVWNGGAYRTFRKELYSSDPPACCRNCGLAWSM